MKECVNLLTRAIWAVALTLALFSSFSYGQRDAETRFDFRYTNWGMTKEEVKATEFGLTEPRDDSDLLVTTGTIGGYMEALIAYIFADGKLIAGKYLFTEKYPSKNHYILEYEKVKQTLTLKYGSPISGEEIWQNKQYKNDPKKKGLALSSGHLIYRTRWGTERTNIALVLQRNKSDNNITFGVIYSSKKLGHLDEEIKTGEGS